MRTNIEIDDDVAPGLLREKIDGAGGTVKVIGLGPVESSE
jgi:hypothetical protein